jgi:hypothetical protein
MLIMVRIKKRGKRWKDGGKRKEGKEKVRGTLCG